jgi:hypothetical protein
MSSACQRFKQNSTETGVYNGKYPSPGGGGGSANVISTKKLNEEEKQGKNVREKQGKNKKKWEVKV